MDQFLASLIPEGETILKLEHLRNLFFGNYMMPDAEVKVYDEVIICIYFVFVQKNLNLYWFKTVLIETQYKLRIATFLVLSCLEFFHCVYQTKLF